VADLTKRLIATLDAGGVAARECLQEVGELLRKAWQPGFVPFGEALQAEESTSDEVVRLREALAAYSRTESDASARRTALSILAKEGSPELREQLVAELHDCLTTHRIVSREIFQLILALEDVGESVFSSGLRSRSLAAVETNVNAASDYLGKQGIQVPWQ
jgi:hypothetical protein